MQITFLRKARWGTPLYFSVLKVMSFLRPLDIYALHFRLLYANHNKITGTQKFVDVRKVKK